jgi:L-alanine-DL-glutamate epimerase-like enolase superfamily enzyme
VGELAVRTESWPMAAGFAIARGTKWEARVVVAELREGDAIGRGECVPYPRYSETVEGVIEAIETLRGALERGMDRTELQTRLAPGAARNALDCALWDLEAKRRGEPAWRLADLSEPQPVITAYTISLDAPDAMAHAARVARERPLLKIKLGADGDAERVIAVREAAPEAQLIADANEGWSLADLERLAPLLAERGVALLEQPLAVDEDAALDGLDCPVPLCADESCHTVADLARLRGRYEFVNVKLDKTGGLSEALAVVRAAQQLGFDVMVGCMVGTSLAMAPAALLAGAARFVDLDGPLLLAHDRDPGLRYENSLLHPPSRALWG